MFTLSETKAKLESAASELRGILLDAENLFYKTWKIPAIASSNQQQSFRLLWIKDDKGNFKMMCGGFGNRRAIQQMSTEDLITTAHMLPALWTALENKQKDLLTQAREAHVATAKFLREVKS